MRFWIAAILSFSFTISAIAAPGVQSYDVVVYGGTPGGIIAAVAAAREGRSVILIEPTDHLGGMVTGGLSATDTGNIDAIGGYALGFFTRTAKKYNAPERHKGRTLFFSEPHIAEQSFHEMLDQAGVKSITGQRVDKVMKTNGRITSITTLDSSTYAGAQFIDAGYEGDLMARAGVKYTFGREAASQYDEPHAGFYPAPLRLRTVEEMSKDDPCVDPENGRLHYVHGTPTKISPYDEHGKLLYGISDEPWPQPGAGDRRIMGYNFRVIVTNNPANRLPFPKPAQYDPSHYALLLRLIEAYPGIRFSKLAHMKNIGFDKYDANNIGMVIGTNHIGFNYDYPDGDYATRDRIWAAHKDWVQGFFWFVSHDPRVPDDLKKQAADWGLCKDEFVDDPQHWPYHLYVREARRMIGRHVFTEHDAVRRILKPDSIAMGSFILDSHAVQRLVHPDGYVIDEGNFDKPTRPYQIPYRIITPLKDHCENLLVPVCVSATHVAYGSLRMEPQYMMMGHAAGVAASQAIAERVAVQDVDIKSLQSKLLAQKQVLELPEAAAALIQLNEGLVIDDEEAEYTGRWKQSTWGRCVDGFYRHDDNASKGLASVKFSFTVPSDGEYELRYVYSAAGNRASNTPITIHSADGVTTMKIDQRKAAPIDDHVLPLGRFRFTKNALGSVVVRNNNTDGYVTVDAIQLLKIAP